MGIINNKKVKIAIIGAGAIAHHHLKALSTFTEVELVGIFSRTKEKAEVLAKEFNIKSVYTNIEDLYNKTHSDSVLITVNEVNILEIIKKCIDFPWKIITEKPPGCSLSETQEIIKITQNHDAYVTLNRRFLSATRSIKQHLEKNDQGKRFVHVQDQQNVQIARKLWNEKVAQFIMYANSIHLIDYISFLCRGRVTEVRPLHKWDPENTSIMLAHIQFDSGDEALYQGVWQGPGPWSMSVNTPNFRYEARPLEQAIYQVNGDRTQHILPIDDKDTQFKPGFYTQAIEIIKASQGAQTMLPKIQDILPTMDLIYQIFGVDS